MNDDDPNDFGYNVPLVRGLEEMQRNARAERHATSLAMLVMFLVIVTAFGLLWKWLFF